MPQLMFLPTAPISSNRLPLHSGWNLQDPASLIGTHATLQQTSWPAVLQIHSKLFGEKKSAGYSIYYVLFFLRQYTSV